jgi:NADH:ubiquinone oxidoreductase subunit 6 (subunit J)
MAIKGVESKMILELIAVGLVISAVLVIYLEDAVYSVASLASTLILMAILYSLNDAGFAAVFQLGISAGTLAVLFLSSETLSEKPLRKRPLRKVFAVTVLGGLLAVPSLVFSSGTTSIGSSSEVTFPTALWNLRLIDIVLQGLVIVTVALGISIILRSKRDGEN